MNPQPSPRQRSLALLLALAILLGLLPRPAQAAAPGQDYTFQECDGVEEAALRDELNRIAQEAVAGEQGKLEVAALVARNWVALDMDSAVDQAIDQAVERVRQEEDYWNRFLSGWSPEKAQEFTGKVTNYAFSQESFQAKLDALSAAVAADLSEQLAAISAKSASSTLLCIQSFIGDRYSGTMATLFQEEIQQKVEKLELASDEETQVTVLLESHTKGLAGVGVIIGAQIVKRLARKLAQRIAGKILGRILGKAATSLVPLAGWIIGGGLIVWDLIESGNGSLPQIQAALKEEDVKAGIRDEITAAVTEELDAELPRMAREVSNDVYSSWLDFKSKYRRVLAQAEEDAAFQELLNETPVEEVYKLATLLDIASQALDPMTLQASFQDGRFERVFNLPEESFAILEAGGSLEETIAWAELAGSSVEQVAALEIHKLKSPQDFADRQALEAVLALEEPSRIQKLLLLDPQAMDALLGLSTENLKPLVDSYSVDDLSWLANYVAEMEQEPKNELIARLLDDPAVIQELKSERVKELVVKSPNVERTLEVLAPSEKRQASPVQALVEDSADLLNGEIPLAIFWRRYGTTRNLGLLAAALLALALLILLFRRRNRPVQVTINLPQGREEKE